MSDLHAALLRKVVFPIGDWWRGTPIGTALRFLDETQWWPREKIEQLQNQKLQALVASSYENVPHYRKVMDERGLRPADIRTTRDLVKLPLLTVSDIRAAGQDGMLHRHVPMKSLSRVRTSGSTGDPKHFFNSKMTEAFNRASFYRFLGWCGATRGEPFFSIWGQPILLGGLSRLLLNLKLRFVTRETLLSAWDMTPQTMRDFIARMRKAGPVVLRGYPSEVTRLAEFMRKEGIEPPTVKAIVTTAEQVFPHDRKILEDVFRAGLFDQYGCGECNGAAYECACHSGLHVAAEHCVIEIVGDKGEQLPPGETGRIALTNLDNEAFPFIRYLNGDEAALISEACPCGRGLPLMTPIAGRTVDVVYGVNGHRAWGGFFCYMVMQLGWIESLKIRGYRFVQTGPDQIRFELASERDPPPDELEKMFEVFRGRLGPMRFEYHKVDRIDYGPANKRRYVIREWNPG